MEIRMKITPNQFTWIFLIVLFALIGWGGFALYQFFKNPAENILSIENEKRFGPYFLPCTYSLPLFGSGFEITNRLCDKGVRRLLDCKYWISK